MNTLRSLMPYFTALDYGLTCYKAARFEAPSSENSVEEIVDDQEFIDFLKKNKIRKDLQIQERYTSGFVQADGTNYFTKGDALISMYPGLKKIAPHAFTLILKHEISHIKFNDRFTIPLIGALTAVVGAILFPRLTSRKSLIFPAIFLTSCIASSLFSTYREKKADDFAIVNSSEEELKEALLFFGTFAEYNIEQRRMSGWKKLIISPSGSWRFDLVHPSLFKRIEKFQHALEQRENNIEEDLDVEKKKALKDLFIDYEENIPKYMAYQIKIECKSMVKKWEDGAYWLFSKIGMGDKMREWKIF